MTQYSCCGLLFILTHGAIAYAIIHTTTVDLGMSAMEEAIQCTSCGMSAMEHRLADQYAATSRCSGLVSVQCVRCCTTIAKVIISIRKRQGRAKQKEMKLC